ncbi:MAG: SpoIIE family protein phosphatase [Humidesulfovibrio sp.]|uniref:SpoIIE family protein phosphatase n=1 Tax=Humidesulfovibrio sp. TaxID=2910988 RepID=UPI0027E95FEC|nr:SpoIIE family protein phosphatase [Humidesulfovibrio sp.]MDQ7836115.1 SpoIIE family protein phosphatase [Humidesulfovibrio sp.]
MSGSNGGNNGGSNGGTAIRAGRGIAFRLSALVLTAVGVIFVAMSVATYHLAREALLKNAEQNARTQAQALVQRIEARLAPISRVPLALGYELSDGLLDDAGILRRQRQMLLDNPEIFGTAAAFEPFGRHPGQEYFAPYTFRAPLGITHTQLGSAAYRYHAMDWYQIPRELKEIVWSEPYYDEGGGNTLMSTCSVPFYKGQGEERRVAGVVTADVSLDWLKRLVASVNVLDTGYAWLITRNGTYVTHPAQGVAFNESIFSRAEEHNDPELRRIGQDMIRGGSKLVESTSLHTGKPGFLVYAPLPSIGWSLGVFSPRDELLADVNRLALVSAGLGGGGFLIIALLTAAIARGITGPLRRLRGAAREVAGGHLDAALPEVTSRDEVHDLAMAFGNMQRSLKEHIRDLTAATATRERIQSELRIASEIQLGILPKTFPPLPGHTEFDLYASLTPAREVGGDFYDFFPCGHDGFCFLIGDVSGKGVPAAFYMAVSRTLLKAVAESVAGAGRRRGADPNGAAGAQRRSLPDPGRILARANNGLAEDNESCMFVTVFCAVLDYTTGEVHYASAGHNPPVLLRAGAAPEYLPTHGDPVAGAMPGVEFTTDSLVLNPGDALVLYTDGVTEAMNPALELYGEERLTARLAAFEAGDARTICEDLAKDVHAFADGAEQSDDITMLVLRYNGGAPDSADKT